MAKLTILLALNLCIGVQCTPFHKALNGTAEDTSTMYGETSMYIIVEE